jgi:hypothetical protein
MANAVTTKSDDFALRDAPIGAPELTPGPESGAPPKYDSI